MPPKHGQVERGRLQHHALFEEVRQPVTIVFRAELLMKIGNVGEPLRLA